MKRNRTRLSILAALTVAGLTGCLEGSSRDPARCGSSPSGCDVDGDGHVALQHGGDDCDDQAPDRFPGAIEVPYDGIDQDCSGLDLTDQDGDGFEGPSGTPGDCDDEDPDRYPGAYDIIQDGIDGNCDGHQDYIYHVAGTGEATFGGDGGPATDASLYRPRGMAVDSRGNLYLGDSGNYRIRRITPDGIITTIAGTSSPGDSGDFGPASEATLNGPTGLAIAPDDTLYLADNYSYRVRKIGPDGIIYPVAGTRSASGNDGDGGPATEATLTVPYDVALAADGRIFISDEGAHQVRMIDQDGIIYTRAGTGDPGDQGDGGPASRARLRKPKGLAVDASGNLYVADSGNLKVRRIDADGTISTYAGTGEEGSTGNRGPATEATFRSIYGLALDRNANLYVADSLNNWIRRIDTAGIITAAVGLDDGEWNGGAEGDGGPASLATLYLPAAVHVGPDGTLWVADSENQRVRKVVP